VENALCDKSRPLTGRWQVEDDLATDLSLIGITGIENPLRESIRETVAKSKNAGVHVIMCTGDKALTTRSIMQQCDITCLTLGGIIMEGGPRISLFRECRAAVRAVNRYS